MDCVKSGKEVCFRGAHGSKLMTKFTAVMLNVALLTVQTCDAHCPVVTLSAIGSS